jgi:hypothetical protein
MSGQELSVWGLLRGHGCLWHRTSLAALDGILRDHEITPNTGQFEATTTQSKASYARHMRAVSLFDFDTASAADFETHRTDYWRGDVFVRIRRDALASTKLRRAEDISTEPHLHTLSDEDKHKLVLIPYLEVLHIGPVPESAFDGFILISPSADFWHETTSDAAGLKELLEIAGKWNAAAERELSERHARGEFTLAELVEASYKMEG